MIEPLLEKSRASLFFSNNASEVPKFGKKAIDINLRTHKSDFLYHPSSAMTFGIVSDNGFNRKKFGTGFSRRMIPPQESVSDLIQQVHKPPLQNTQQQSKTYNIITGDGVSSQMTIENRGLGRVESKPNLRIAQLQMHESFNRYFAHKNEGSKNNLRRTETLVTDGLNSKKYSSLLGVGTNDLPSFGVEDQFSKSEYFKKTKTSMVGLHETRLNKLNLASNTIS